MWTPRPILDSWTPDQARIANHFPAARRLCVCAANGVGKTYLAADLAVSFLLDHTAAIVITTAPTQRQVEQLLWPEVVKRLKHLGLMEADAEPGPPEWISADGDRYIGFATNKPARMQGIHAPAMLIIIDEASGVTGPMIEATEALAIGEENYIFAIGNPNEPTGAFYTLTRTPSWRQEQLSALTHPNIVTRTETIPGATNWRTLLQRCKDWAKRTEQPTADSFTLSLTPEEIAYLDDTGATEPPTHDTGATQHDTHFIPNDAFRVRYLGRFPEQASGALFSPQIIEACQDRVLPSGGRRFAALDVARLGGDETIYACREGNTIIALEVIPAATLPEQCDDILRRLTRDNPESLKVDAAGLGIGLIDHLRLKALLPVIEFQPGGEPLTMQDQKRFFNRRAQAYGNFAEAMMRGQVSIPKDDNLAADLLAVLYRHTPDQQLQILDKATIKAKTGRSPDRGDAVSMLWEDGSYYRPTASATAQANRHREDIEW